MAQFSVKIIRLNGAVLDENQQPMGFARFEPTANSGSPAFGIGGSDGYAQVQSGALETSNVDMTVEMTGMIRAQQQFSGAARILQTNSDMIEKLTQR